LQGLSGKLQNSFSNSSPQVKIVTLFVKFESNAIAVMAEKLGPNCPINFHLGLTLGRFLPSPIQRDLITMPLGRFLRVLGRLFIEIL